LGNHAGNVVGLVQGAIASIIRLSASFLSRFRHDPSPFSPSHTHLDEPLRKLHRGPASRLCDAVPDAPAAAKGEETHLAFADVVPDKEEHLVRFHALQPFLFRHGVSLLRENKVYEPASASVWSRLAAVDEDVSVIATGVIKSIGQNREKVEVRFLVDAPNQGLDGGR
jgi:uncharacterized membrane protein